MNYFPAFLPLHKNRVAVIGAGSVAYEKISKLLDFTDKVTIIAPDCSRQNRVLIDRYSLLYLDRPYSADQLDEFDVVIVAIDNLKLQQKIYQDCQDRSILCNCVDLIECCDFIFGSYVKRGDLVVAISTSGASPSFAKYLKKIVEKVIPKDAEKFLSHMRDLRAKFPKGKQRMKMLDREVKEYFDTKLGSS